MQMQVRLGGCNADVMLGKFDLIIGEGEEAPEGGSIDMWHQLCISGSEDTIVRHPRADGRPKPPAKGSMSLSNSDDA
jgi:hypothetical protein